MRGIDLEDKERLLLNDVELEHSDSPEMDFDFDDLACYLLVDNAIHSSNVLLSTSCSDDEFVASILPPCSTFKFGSDLAESNRIVLEAVQLFQLFHEQVFVRCVCYSELEAVSEDAESLRLPFGSAPLCPAIIVFKSLQESDRPRAQRTSSSI